MMFYHDRKSLNPSFIGIWSRIDCSYQGIRSKRRVLILLLVEYGLGLEIKDHEIDQSIYES